MDIYGTKQIRNVVLLGHGGAGKTTVAEALAYLTGVTKRMGKVADGNTISDYDKEEIKRQFSISTTMVPIEYEGAEGKIKINLLDTPGYFDFVGEVEEAVSAADAAIIVVNCKAGIEVGTEKAWDLCEEYKLPRIIFVTNMDDDHASFRELILKLEKKFGRKIAPFQVPIRENEKFVGFVNAVKMQGRRFTNLSDYEDCEIPEYTKKNLGIIRDALIEAVAETSEEYMERYFSGEEFTQDEIYTAVQTHVCDGSIVPVMMGSGINCQGFNALLNAIDRYFPSPDKGECVGVDVSNGEHFTAKYNDEVSLSARVFKTIVDPFIGKYSLMKVCTGTLKPDSTLYNVNKDAEEKIAKVYVLRGKDVIEVPELKAGDIGAVAKLSVTQTGDTIALRSAPIVYHKPKISTPYTYMRFAAKTKGDEDKISSALARMMEEDLTLRVVNDTENRQSLLYGIGDQQLEVTVSKLLGRYKVDVELSKPKFAFARRSARKWRLLAVIRNSPVDMDSLVTLRCPSSRPAISRHLISLKKKYSAAQFRRTTSPAVEKGVQECCTKGPLAGYPVVGIKATLLDGSYHPVDSSEMAFKMAATLAFKKGFMDANPVLLEPIASVKVVVPDKFTGDVMGDLNRRRGRVLGMNSLHGGKQEIVADVSDVRDVRLQHRPPLHDRRVSAYSPTNSAAMSRLPGDVQKKEVEARTAGGEVEA